MATYKKISDMTAASALDGTELIETVQSSAPRKATIDQIVTRAAASLRTAAAGAATAATSVYTYIFNPDDAPDISGDLSDGMSSVVTVSSIPSNTRAILLGMRLSDTGTNVMMRARASAASIIQDFRGVFADGGANVVSGSWWLSTFDNTFKIDTLNADTTIGVFVLGYMAET